jgi:hypothetical protein
LSLRGRGYFKTLMNAVFARLRVANVDTIFLNALPGSVCVNVYTRLGFNKRDGQSMGALEWVYSKGAQNVFVRPLPAVAADDDDDAAAAAAPHAFGGAFGAAAGAAGGGGAGGGGGGVHAQVARKTVNRAPAASDAATFALPPLMTLPSRAPPAAVPGTAAAGGGAKGTKGSKGLSRAASGAERAPGYAADDAQDTDPEAGPPPDWPEKHIPFVSAPLWCACLRSVHCFLRRPRKA